MQVVLRLFRIKFAANRCDLHIPAVLDFVAPVRDLALVLLRRLAEVVGRRRDVVACLLDLVLEFGARFVLCRGGTLFRLLGSGGQRRQLI
jgi:hypothetical protein